MEKKQSILLKKLAKIKPQENNIELAQCYCEYSQSLEPESAVEKRSVLQKALSVSPTCVRASLLLANLAMLDGQYQQAVKILENVLEQNPDYTGEILLPLKHCYEELNQLDNFELFLIRAGSNY